MRSNNFSHTGCAVRLTLSVGKKIAPTDRLRRALIRLGTELPSVGLGLLFAAPLAVALVHHPGWALGVIAVGALAAAWYLVRRLRAHGEMRYLVYYLLFLYPLLAPGMLAGARPRYFIFYYALTSILLFLPQVMRPHLLWKAACGLGVLVALVVAAVFSAYAAQTGKLLDSAGLIAIYQTDVAEAVAYMRTFSDPAVLVLIAAVLLSLLLLATTTRWSTLRAFPRGYQVLVLISVLGLSWETVAASNELRLLSTFLDYHRSIEDYRRMAALRQVDQRQIEARLSRAAPETHVIVIGESNNRNHMGLYGYFRETTPHLSRMVAELVVFKDVISSYPHTLESLHKALTLADVDNQLDYADTNAFSIIELLRAAGVRTYWLSNQNRYGIWDNVVTVIAEGAGHVDFHSKHVGEDDGAEPDERLLPALERVVGDGAGDKVIFIHLMGMHWPYDRRYTPEFGRFGGPLPASAFGDRERNGWITEMVNKYDNANLYVDHLLYRMIEILRRNPASTSLLYFADHGEAPLEGFGHDAARFNRDQVEVPFFLWFSERFAELHPELVQIAKGNRDKKFMLDELEDTVLDLVGVETPYLEPERSLLRATYADASRMTLDGEIDYDRYDDPLLNARRNMREIGATRPALYERMWAHRVNSLGKLSEVVDVFAGAELDLVFDEATGRLEVRHPPKPYNGLTLEEVLTALRARHTRTRLWLDLENVNEDNSAELLARLSELDLRYGLKDRVIAETTFTGKGFEDFAASGFYTSYYLPTETVLAALKEDDTDRLTQLAAEACAVAQRHRVAAISFDIRLYPFVREYLAPCAAAHDLDYLTWDLALSTSATEFAEVASRWDLDERIKVILVPFASRYDI